MLFRSCIGAVYPSKYTELYFKDLHPKMVSLFNDLGVKNGTLTISAFVEDSNIHLYDPGYRLQGEAQNIHIEELCGYDQKTMLIEFALGGSMGKVNLYDLIDYNFNGKHAATLWLLSKAGQIGSIEGLEEVSTNKNTTKIVQRFFEGDIVLENMLGTEAQVIARIYLKADTRESLLETIDYYVNNIKITDNKGYNMLLSMLTTSELI